MAEEEAELLRAPSAPPSPGEVAQGLMPLARLEPEAIEIASVLGAELLPEPARLRSWPDTA
jgi:hypothetical protein